MPDQFITSLVFDFGGVVFPVEPYSGPAATPEERALVTPAIQSIVHENTEAIASGTFSISDFHREFTKRAVGLSVERQKIITKSICAPDQDLLHYLQLLHERYALYGLINAPFGWTEIRRALHHFETIFTRIVVSHEINIRKPDPRIFQHFLEQTQLKPEECLFIDDKPENTVAAQKLGFAVHLFSTPTKLKRAISELN